MQNIVGLGTAANVIGIVIGGIIGLFAGSRFSPRMRETLLMAQGMAIIAIGFGGTFAKMLVISDGHIEMQGALMMIVSLALGAVIGEIIDIDRFITDFGEWLKKKSGSEEAGFVAAFVNASCTVGIGAMAVVGSIADAVAGDISILVTKSIIDMIIIAVMTAAQGIGCIFSALFVGIFQGMITVAAFFCGSFMTAAAVNNLSYVGNILIAVVGMNVIRLNHTIRVANLIPAIVIAALWS